MTRATTTYEVVRSTTPGDALVVHTGSRTACRIERRRLETRDTATYTVRVCDPNAPGWVGYLTADVERLRRW